MPVVEPFASGHAVELARVLTFGVRDPSGNSRRVGSVESHRGLGDPLEGTTWIRLDAFMFRRLRKVNMESLSYVLVLCHQILSRNYVKDFF